MRLTRIAALCFFIFLLMGRPIAAWDGEGVFSGPGKNSRPAENVLLAMHFGRSHHQHHGEGRQGSGICPQTRTTAKAPEEDRLRKNPLASSRINFDAGESLFNLLAEPTTCKMCHGVRGNGLGMMAQGLPRMPRNFACSKTMRNISDGQLFWVIRYGSPGAGMPAYKFLTDEQIWQLAIYVRHFAK